MSDGIRSLPAHVGNVAFQHFLPARLADIWSIGHLYTPLIAFKPNYGLSQRFPYLRVLFAYPRRHIRLKNGRNLDVDLLDISPS